MFECFFLLFFKKGHFTIGGGNAVYVKYQYQIIKFLRPPALILMKSIRSPPICEFSLLKNELQKAHLDHFTGGVLYREETG